MKIMPTIFSDKTDETGMLADVLRTMADVIERKGYISNDPKINFMFTSQKNKDGSVDFYEIKILNFEQRVCPSQRNSGTLKPELG